MDIVTDDSNVGALWQAFIMIVSTNLFTSFLQLGALSPSPLSETRLSFPSLPCSRADLHASLFLQQVVSEIGDKTFLIAAILASRQPRLTVFAGAFGSLIVMSILSAAMGRVIGLVPKQWTQYAVSRHLYPFLGLRGRLGWV